MKKLDLNTMGVVEINRNKIKTTDGGIAFLLGVLLGGLIYDILSDPGAIVDGFSDGYNNHEKVYN